MSKHRYWKMHLKNDPYDHWICVDCGKPVCEPEAVRLTEAAYRATGRGAVTAATPDPR